MLGLEGPRPGFFRIIVRFGGGSKPPKGASSSGMLGSPMPVREA